MTDKAELPEYEASTVVFVDGELYPAGKRFSTDKPVGKTWSPVNAEAKAKVKAHDKDVLADIKAVDGDADVAARLDQREAKVRAELADEIAALQKRAEAAEAKAGAGNDEAFDALVEESKGKDAEIAELRARLKVFEPFDGDNDGAPGGSQKRETLSLKK